MKKILLGLLVSIALGACSSEEGGTDGSIILTGGTETSQTIYADETQKSEGIKFTATEPWTATVTETKTRADGGSTVDWLKLSAYSGGAGEFTLNLTLSPNTTGKSRKAEIRIIAGKTVLTITVEQKAETESGVEVLKTIKKIIHKAVFNSNKVYSSDYISEDTRTFSYDEQGRVARIVLENGLYNGKENSTMTFDYTIAGEITMNEKEVYDSNVYEDTYIIKLNEQGNVTSVQDDDKNTGTFSDYIRFSYTDDNRLAQWKDADAGSETSSGTFSYNNGVLLKYEYISGKSLEDSRAISVDVSKAYIHRYPNNLPVDMVGLLLSDDDDYDFLFYIGRTGKTSDYLPEVIPDFTARDEWDYVNIEGYPTPNITFEESSYTIEWSNDDLVMNYTFDKDNYLTGIQAKRGFTVMKTTYTVVVGDELVDPNIPGRGYKYTIKNKNTTKEKDDTDVFTWTIEY